MPDVEALYVIVRESGVCVTTGSKPQIFLDRNPKFADCPAERIQYLGHRGAVPCYAVELAADTPLP